MGNIARRRRIDALKRSARVPHEKPTTKIHDVRCQQIGVAGIGDVTRQAIGRRQRAGWGVVRAAIRSSGDIISVGESVVSANGRSVKRVAHRSRISCCGIAGHRSAHHLVGDDHRQAAARFHVRGHEAQPKARKAEARLRQFIPAGCCRGGQGTQTATIRRFDQHPSRQPAMVGQTGRGIDDIRGQPVAGVAAIERGLEIAFYQIEHLFGCDCLRVRGLTAPP